MGNETRETYRNLAYQRAGIDKGHWRPDLGFQANEDILHKVYRYYQSIYFEQPDTFLWAGLARLTGGQVLFGMNNAVKIARDPCVLTQEITAVAKDIFESLGWQHELFLQDPERLMQVCQLLNDEVNPVHPYALCWQRMLSLEPEQVALGNKMLLENEQRNTIQPHYETIRRDAYSNRYFRLTRFVMRNIHPHHRRFIFDLPWGDVTQFDDRWQWISQPGGMWPTWVELDRGERDRLVALSNEAVIAHDW